MGAQMQRGAYSRVCGASTAKRPAALGYAGAGPARGATGTPVMRRHPPLRQIHAALVAFDVRAVGRERREAGIVHRAADGEVVERLEGEVLEAKDLVDRVIEEAADARRPHTRRFGLQIQNLPDHTRLPEQPPVEPWPVLEQGLLILGDHPQGKGAVSGDVLKTAHLGGQPLRVAALQQVERQVRRTPRRRGPGEVLVHGPLELVQRPWVAGQDVQAWIEAIYPVDEQAEVASR